MLPPEEELLSDKELRDASPEQIQHLIARFDLMLCGSGQPGIMVRQLPEEQPDTPEPSDPADPNAG